MAELRTSSSDPLDWENRRLCRDERCIGIIGRDGRCTECGLPGDDDGPGRTAERDAGSDVPDPVAASVEVAGTAEDHGPEAAAATPGEADRYWQQRRLCPDGNCIGVLGPDGRCKECGRAGGDGA